MSSGLFHLMTRLPFSWMATTVPVTSPISMVRPTFIFFPGLTMQSHSVLLRRSVTTISMLPSFEKRRAGMTLVSFRMMRSSGCMYSGKSLNMRCSILPVSL